MSLFAGVELMVLLIIFYFIYQIVNYIIRYRKNNIDFHIVASFTCLAIAGLVICGVNLAIYGLVIYWFAKLCSINPAEYSSDDYALKAKEEFFQWNVNNYERSDILSFDILREGIAIRNISFFINLARWFITIK